MSLDLYAADLADMPFEPAARPIDFGEGFAAAWTENRRFVSTAARERLRAEVLSERVDALQRATGEVFPQFDTTKGFAHELVRRADAEFPKIKARHPDKELPSLAGPDIDAEVARRAGQARRARLEAEERASGFGAGLGLFLGDIAGSSTDPINIIGMAFGARVGTGILRTALTEGAIGLGTQSGVESFTGEFKREADPEYGAADALANIGMAGAGGAIIGGGARSLGVLWSKVRAREWPRTAEDAGNVVMREADAEASTPPTAAPGYEAAAHRTNLDAAEQALATNEPVDVPLPLTGGRAGQVFTVGPERPAIQPRMSRVNVLAAFDKFSDEVRRTKDDAVREAAGAAMKAEFPEIAADVDAVVASMSAIGRKASDPNFPAVDLEDLYEEFFEALDVTRGVAADKVVLARAMTTQAPPARVFDAENRALDVRYELVEARDLVTSNLDDFSVNPAYPPELQPRDRTRAANQEQVFRIAADLEPERLGPSPDAATGAPIVGPDDVVESGNGRVMALRKVYAGDGRRTATDAPRLEAANQDAEPRLADRATLTKAEEIKSQRFRDLMDAVGAGRPVSIDRTKGLFRDEAEAERILGRGTEPDDVPEEDRLTSVWIGDPVQGRRDAIADGLRDLFERENPDLVTKQQLGLVLSMSGPRVRDTGRGIDTSAAPPVRAANDEAPSVAPLRTAAEPSRADAYRTFLQSRGYDVSGFQQPVLIARRTSRLSDAERLAVTTAANRATAMRLSPAEQALADARLIDDGLLEVIQPGEPTSAGNRTFVRGFADKLPQAERGPLFDAEGVLSQEGARRVTAALLARAYGDPLLLGRLLEDADSNMRAIGGAMADTAGVWAAMRSAVTRGELPQSMDITNDLLDAFRVVARARDSRRPIRELVDQAEMFERPSAVSRMLLGFMFRGDDLAKPAGRPAMREALESYVDAALKNTTDVRLFGEPLDAPDVLSTALRSVGRADLVTLAQQAVTPAAIERAMIDPKVDAAVLADLERLQAGPDAPPTRMIPLDAVDASGADSVAARSLDEMIADVDAETAAALELRNCALGSAATAAGSVA